MKYTLTLTILAALSAASGSRAEDWTGFRGPGGKAVSAEKNLPDKWSQTEGLRWAVDLPGRGLSCPVVAGGKVFVTACTGYRETRLHVLCFDEATGKKLWERQFNATGNTGCHPKTNMAAPTPVTDGKNVYALFATADLAAYDADGNLLWMRSLVGDYPNLANQVGMASSPTLTGDVLLLAMENVGDSFRAGIDKKTGQNVWKIDQPRDINWVTPFLFGEGKDQVAVFYTMKEITAYDPATGRMRWTLPVEKTSSMVSPTTGSGLLFVPGQELLALKPGPDNTSPQVVWKSTRLQSTYASPVFHEGRLYALTNVGVRAVNAQTGEAIKTEKSGEEWFQRVNGPFAASPVLADGKLYIVNEKGTTTVIKLGPSPEVIATNELNDTILATPTVANGAIYLRSDKKLYCIGVKK
jgi:outer membrane protein assembly factor BamB